MSDLESLVGDLEDDDLTAEPIESAEPVRRNWVRLLLEPTVFIVVAALVLVWALMYAAPALKFQLSEVFIAILFAVAVSYVTGVSGTPAFGNELFYAGGAYFVAVVTTKHSVQNVFLLLGGAVLVALVLGALMSLLLKKVSGVAFGMVTLAISQMFYVYVGVTKYLGEDNGISGISAGTFFGTSLINPSYLLAFVWAVVVIGVGLIALVARSRLGLLTRASRDSSSRAGAVGLATFRYHALAFTLGAGFCGLAGSLTAISVGTVDVSMFYWTAGAVPILAGLMGGIRTIKGPIVGSIILSIVIIWISTHWKGWLLIEGGVTLGVFLLWPQGLLGEGQGSAITAAKRLVRFALRPFSSHSTTSS